MGAPGNQLPDPGFAGDSGRPDAALAAALVAHDQGEVGESEVLGALVAARVLVPVVALLVEGDRSLAGAASRQEKASDMALVTLVGRDDRRALPVFTSLAALAAWRPDARPVPVEAPRAALSAVAEGAAVLIVDVAGPHRFDVSGPALEALARGRGWIPPHADPDVRMAIETATAAEPTLVAVQVGAGENGSVRVTLSHIADADLAAVTAAVSAVATRLADDEVIRHRARQGLELVVIPT